MNYFGLIKHRICTKMIVYGYTMKKFIYTCRFANCFSATIMLVMVICYSIILMNLTATKHSRYLKACIVFINNSYVISHIIVYITHMHHIHLCVLYTIYYLFNVSAKFQRVNRIIGLLKLT